MQIAACIHKKETAGLLSELFEEFQEQHDGRFISRFFRNDTDLIAGFNGGEYDAVFFDGPSSGQIAAEIREKDRRVRLIRIAEVGGAAEDGGDVWYCLPEPVSKAFVFPVLARLLGDTAQENQAGLLIKNRSRVTHLVFSHIRYVEVMGKSVFFHLDDSRTEEVRGTLSDFEAKLLEWPDFIKVHRAYIVNLRHVERMEANSILLHGGHSVPGSKYLYPQIRRDWLCGLMDPSVTPKNQDAGHTHKGDCARDAYSILLVDDEETDRRRFSRLFTDKGCAVRTVDSGGAAFAAAAEERFDCVVLDVRLGGTSGFDLCERLHHLTGAPVVYLSVLADSESQTRGFLSGGIDYITKDTTDQLIWLKIETRMQMAQAAKAELSFEGLRLDLKNRRAFLHGRELSLTTVEFDLLCVLMRNPGVTYTPSRLYEMIWGAKQWDDGQTVQIHMAGLVRKLESGGTNHGFIETIWGEGYRFAAAREGGGKK